MSAPHNRGECDWCRWELGDDAIQWNGGVGHAACVAWIERIVLGDDAAPGRPAIPRRHLRREDPVCAFATRLGREAVRLEIDRQKLATAIQKAHHAA